MITLRTSLSVFVLAVTLPAYAQQSSLIGVVQTPNHEPVTHENVMIESAALGPYETSDTGRFSFPLTQNLSVGHEATFRLQPGKKNKWVIVYPCDLRNGRKDSLPALGTPVSIVVALWGSAELKKYYPPNCIIEELASQLKPAPARPSKALGAGLLLKTDPLFIPQKEREYLPISRRFYSNAAWLKLKAVYRVPVSEGFSEPTPEDTAGSRDSGLDEFLAAKAGELGLTAKDLATMVEAWTASVGTSYEMGLAAFSRGRYAEASKYISESIRSSAGDILKEYVVLARAEYEQGHYAAAEAALRKVLAVHNDDPLILNLLGLVLLERANYSEAEPLFKRSLAIDEKARGPEHLDVATELNNLALLYKTQGKYAEAEPLYKQSLAIAEKALGPQHPEVATKLNNLAVLYAELGKYEKAEALYKRALAIDENTLASDSPALATDLNNLALLYDEQSKYEKAEPLYKRALAIDEKTLGPEHPVVATTLNNLALLYKHQKKYVEAEPLYKRALAIDEKVLGAEHPAVATKLNNLAALYNEESKYEEAEALYKRALAIDEKALGPDHQGVATDLNNLALLYDEQGKHVVAEPLYKRALAIDEKALGPEHPNVGRDLSNLALLYKHQEKYEQAESLYKRSLTIKINGLGPDHPSVAITAENLAVLLRKLSRNDEAKVYEEQAAHIRAKQNR